MQTAAVWSWYLLATGLLASASSQADTSVNVESLHIASYISYRFATTHVTSRLLNAASSAREIGYEVQLPQAAFISNFSMLIDGKVYPGIVKEKEKAKREYERAKDRGQSAGHVVAKSRTANIFRVSVNIASDKAVTFNLTYQELLKRRVGYYEHVIYIDPGQLVEDMRIEVFMLESRPITSIIVPPIRNDLITSDDKSMAMNSLTMIDRPSANSAYIRYELTVDQQKAKRDAGIQGQFVVRYDVQHDAGSDILVFNGYFVHFIAPKGLKPIPRDVLFILDISGSMQGEKIEQVKQAMLTILSDVKEGDRFNIAEFSYHVKFWYREFVPVTKDLIATMKKQVMNIRADGGTNMYGALTEGVDFIVRKGGRYRAALMIFLTDGHASHGITDKQRMIDDTTRLSKGQVALFGLAFGSGADYGLIKSVAARNNGIARKIYVQSDAKLQLTGFYDEVSTPLLSSVTIKYVGDNVKQESITKNLFFNYYDGSELVIAGQITPNDVMSMDLYITADKADGMFLERETVTPSLDLTQQQLGFGENITEISRRLWAYLTIKQLLAQIDATSDATQIANLKRRALALSLQNGFVTPLTSMVVTKPDEEQVASDSETRSQGRRHPMSSKRRPPTSSRRKSPTRQGGSPSWSSSRQSGSTDGDPHFIVPLIGASLPICFDAMGNDGDIFQLISDPERGIYANARVFKVNVTKLGKHQKSVKLVFTNKTAMMTREYINAITVLAPGVRLSLSNTRITVQYGRTLEPKRFLWRDNNTISVGDVRISIIRQHAVTMEIGGDVILRVLKHRHRRQGLVFLGLYIDDGTGLSQRVGGLLGELRYKRVKEIPVGKDKKTTRALLTIRDSSGYDHIAMVRLMHRMDLATKTRVPCWSMDPSDQRGINLSLSPQSYIVPELNMKYVRKRRDHVKL